MRAERAHRYAKASRRTAVLQLPEPGPACYPVIEPADWAVCGEPLSGSCEARKERGVVVPLLPGGFHVARRVHSPASRSREVFS